MITVQIQTISSVKASDMNSKDGIFPATPSHSQPLVDAIKLRAVPIVDADGIYAVFNFYWVDYWRSGNWMDRLTFKKWCKNKWKGGYPRDSYIRHHIHAL